MAVNKYKPHVWVVPEDDATRQLANGFLLHPSLDGTCIDIRQASGGWAKVLSAFEASHIADLRKYPLRHLILLIDFDDQVEGRTQKFLARFPEDVSERIYLLGSRSAPEPLRIAMGRSLEKIGEELAKACAAGEPGPWSHELLKHNATELARLTTGVKLFLFR